MASGGHYPPRVEQRFWREREVRKLSGEARTFLAWLYTCEKQTAVPGLILEGRGALAESVGYSMEVFDRLIGTLISAGFVLADWDVMILYLPEATKMRCNCATSIYQAAHWRRVLNDAPSCPILERVEQDVRDLLGQNQARDKGKAMLASFLLGQAVSSDQADLVLANVAPQPQQQTLPFPWTTPPSPSAAAQPLNKEPDIMPLAHRADSLPAGSASAVSIDVPDDDAALAFRKVVAGAGGCEALGLARVYGHDDVGLPGSAGALWKKAWGELRKTRPATTLQGAAILGEYGSAGGWDGLEVPWQALVKGASGLAAQLDAADLWVRRGRPSIRKGAKLGSAATQGTDGPAMAAAARLLSWSFDDKGNPVAASDGGIGTNVTIAMGDAWEMEQMRLMRQRERAGERVTLDEVRKALGVKPPQPASEAASAVAKQIQQLLVLSPPAVAARGGR